MYTFPLISVYCDLVILFIFKRLCREYIHQGQWQQRTQNNYTKQITKMRITILMFTYDHIKDRLDAVQLRQSENYFF